ncbi:MAG: 1-(5-phosphoribosyl)-5-[(5-phosphoribosylamino)methylideneamino]imidazole-4-carboxamide isomerase [Oscillospiraceae bacterium]|nr:1-(5-phosphoribosyl)-5-[(5-phosphoribosylamino)methylideneamino]imidazole-4-carboxamide isomerase [Oscillospiraceae bacterium]
MLIFPAIDLYEGRAVRLTRGDYAQMTVYGDDPPSVAEAFKEAGARCLHVVDLEGARDGATPNFDVVRAIIERGADVQVGGGIRSADAVRRYLDAGAARVILGTAAITSPGFVRDMTASFGGRIAVSVDIKDGFAAIRGWTELSGQKAFDFCRSMEDAGVRAVVCTDISKDGLLSGANLPLYRELAESFSLDIIASGGVSSPDDIAALRDMGLYGAILGKALYTGGVDLAEAISVAEGMGRA